MNKCVKRTPGLDVHGDNRLGNGLRLGLLLLLVGLQTLLTDSGSLGVILLVATEQVDIIIIIGLLLSLGWVDGQLRGLRAIRAVGLGGIAGESGEFALVASNVLVPASSVRVLLRVGGRAKSLESGNISLRGTLTRERRVSFLLFNSCGMRKFNPKKNQFRVALSRFVCVLR